MSNSYTEELAEWVKKRPKKKRQQDAITVAFLAVRLDVTAAIDAGYALTTIWEHMSETGKLKCSYETFRKHAQRHIKSVPKNQAKSADPSDQTKEKSKPIEPKAGNTKTRPKKESEPPSIGGFTFNATPNKEDLF
jgi:hypothetical protein